MCLIARDYREGRRLAFCRVWGIRWAGLRGEYFELAGWFGPVLVILLAVSDVEGLSSAEEFEEPGVDDSFVYVFE